MARSGTGTGCGVRAGVGVGGGAGLVVAAVEGGVVGASTGSGAGTGAGGGTGAQANSKTIETSRSDNIDRRTHPPTRLPLARRRNNHRLLVGECQLTFGLQPGNLVFPKNTLI